MSNTTIKMLLLVILLLVAAPFILFSLFSILLAFLGVPWFLLFIFPFFLPGIAYARRLIKKYKQNELPSERIIDEILITLLILFAPFLIMQLLASVDTHPYRMLLFFGILLLGLHIYIGRKNNKQTDSSFEITNMDRKKK